MPETLTIKVGGIIDSHSARRLAPVIPEEECLNKGDIVNYVRKNVVKKVGDGDSDYVLEEIVVEDSRVNRQAYIDKDANQVGVLNILEKVRRSGDMTLLNQTGLTFEASGDLDSLGRPLGKIQDYSNAPKSIGEALKAVEKGAASFEGLKAIFGDTSFDALASMSPEEITAKVNAYVASKQKAPESEGNK